MDFYLPRINALTAAIISVANDSRYSEEEREHILEVLRFECRLYRDLHEFMKDYGNPESAEELS